MWIDMLNYSHWAEVFVLCATVITVAGLILRKLIMAQKFVQKSWDDLIRTIAQLGSGKVFAREVAVVELSYLHPPIDDQGKQSSKDEEDKDE